MELLPREQVTLERFLATIRAGYERFGFLPIETPVMELRDILLTKSGGDTEKQVYFVQSTGSLERGDPPKFALRFDLTVPLARYVAEHEHDLAFPFRRYQIQRVYRGESAQKGRFREFYQCDVDVIGKEKLGLATDAEMPVVIDHVFGALGVGAFTIQISNRKILRGLLRHLGVTDPEVAGAVLREIDKIDKRGRDAVEATLRETAEFGLVGDAIETLLEAVSITGPREDAVPHLRALGCDDAGFAQGVAELDEVLAAIADFGVPTEHFRANLAIARGLDYYTGTVFETLLDEHPEIGSVCSGGRYDDLASHYTKSKLPGVGISIGATRLFEQLRAAGVIDADPESSTRVFVAVMGPDVAEPCRRIATELRAAGINTEVHAEGWKLGKQLKYANKAKIRYAVIVGDNELANETAVIKDLFEGSQREVPLADLAKVLRGVDAEA